MKTKKYFSDKVILITGAGSGIGKALSQEISRFSPKKLILADIDDDSLGKIQNSLSNHVKTDIYKVDVASEEQMKQLFEDIITKNSRIDIVFNNAGITAGGEFYNYSFDLWSKLINVNLWGVIYGSSFAYKRMILQKSGHIVNVASLGGLIPEPMATAYSTTKHAVVGLTLSLREEAHEYGVNVSVVCPGVINTPIFDKAIFVGNVDPGKVKSATLEHGAISPVQCAEKILKGMANNKGIILVKPFDKVFWRLYRLSPGILSPLNKLIAKYFRENFNNG